MLRLTACSLCALILMLSATRPAAAQPPGPMPVAVSEVLARDVPPSVRLVGTVRPDKTATIAAEVDGVIATFDVDEGQFLAPGDVICRVDDTVARLKLDEARATLEGLRAQLTEYENGERPEEIQRLEALVAETEADVKKWEYERTRVNALYEQGQSNPKEKHDTEMEYRAAQQRLGQARAQLTRARNGARVEVIQKARHAVAAQEAIVRRLERDLEKTSIRAPFAGAITEKHTEVGEWIEEGGAVCRMVALDTVRIRADVPEEAIAFARPQRAATIEIPALDNSRSAQITRVIPQATPAARTFPVEIDLSNTDRKLLPGMFVWAYVPSGPSGKRLLVSKDAIVAEGTRKTIYIVRDLPNGEHLAEPVAVKTGLEVGDLIEVQAEGLTAGATVVSRANERLMGRPMPVIPQPAATLGAPTTRPAAAAASEPGDTSSSSN